VVPANPMNRIDELAHLLSDSGAKLMIFDQNKVSEISPFIDEKLYTISVDYTDYLGDKVDLPFPESIIKSSIACQLDNVKPWREVVRYEDNRPLPIPDPKALSIMPYTSGTTGHPKGCIHTNQSMMVTAASSALWFAMSSNTRQLVTLP